MVVDKEASGLSRVHVYYSKCNPPLRDLSKTRKPLGYRESTSTTLSATRPYEMVVDKEASGFIESPRVLL